MNFYLLVAMSLLLVGCWSGDNPMDELEPPVAEQRDKILSIHGDDRVDEYYWIRDDQRRDPDVLNLLAQEIAYTKAMMSHSEKFQETLFD
jgi:oligopeptidase B